MWSLMMRISRFAAIGVVSLLLTSCSPVKNLEYTAEESQLPACAQTDPVEVETLPTSDQLTCDPRGVDLLFPDGTTLSTRADGGGGSESTTTGNGSPVYTHAYVYVGADGFVASSYTDECSDMINWGRDEAIKRVVDAFGEDLGHC